MQFKKIAFEDFSSVKFDLSTFENESECTTILLIRFESMRDVNWRDLRFMNAIKLAATHVWHASGVILDLRNLPYKYGDTMEELFRNPYPAPTTELQKIFLGEQGEPCLIVAVDSELNRSGLRTLVEQEMRRDPETVLFDSVESASQYLSNAMKGT